MNEQQIEKLRKLFDVIREDTVTPKDIEKFLLLVVDVVKKSKDSFEYISQKNLQEISAVFNYLKNHHGNVLADVEAKHKELSDSLETWKSEVMSTRPKDGKDADEEAIAANVLSKIRLPKDGKNGIDGSPDKGKEIVGKINELPDEEDLKIDASHIKNLPLPESNGSGLRNVFHDTTLSGTGTMIDPLTVIDIPSSGQYKIYVTVGFEDADYICDGADDDVQIQAAIDYVHDNGGGKVVIKPGTYDINSNPVYLKTYVFVDGLGVGITILKRNDTSGISVPILCPIGENISNFGISNLTVDANDPPPLQLNHVGLKIGQSGYSASYVYLNNIQVINSNSEGMLIYGVSYGWFDDIQVISNQQIIEMDGINVYVSDHCFFNNLDFLTGDDGIVFVESSMIHVDGVTRENALYGAALRISGQLSGDVSHDITATNITEKNGRWAVGINNVQTAINPSYDIAISNVIALDSKAAVMFSLDNVGLQDGITFPFNNVTITNVVARNCIYGIAQQSTSKYVIKDATISNVVIENCTQGVMFKSGENITFNDIDIHDCTDVGFYFVATQTSGNNFAKNIKLNNVEARNCINGGIVLNTQGTTPEKYQSNFYLTNCSGVENTGPGIKLINGYALMNNVKGWLNSTHGIEVDSVNTLNDTYLLDCLGESNTEFGIKLNTGSVVNVYNPILIDNGSGNNIGGVVPKSLICLTPTGFGIGTALPTHTLTLPSTSTGISLYNTTDQTTNYSRGLLQWDSSILKLYTNRAGSASSRPLKIGSSDSTTGDDSSGAFLTISKSTSPQFTFLTNSNALTTLVDISTNGNTLSAGTFTTLNIHPTIAQTGTAGYTIIRVDVSETTTGSGSELLLDLQVGSSSKFKVSSTGLTTVDSLTAGLPVVTDGSKNLASVSYATFASNLDHNSLTNLAVGDVHTQYALLAGRAGNQVLIGGTTSGGTLTLQSTSNGTKGKILFGNSAYDEVNNYLGIGTTSPTHAITLPSASSGLSIYNTADQTTNYERGLLSWQSNVLTLDMQIGGSGTQRSFAIHNNVQSGGSVTFPATNSASQPNLNIIGMVSGTAEFTVASGSDRVLRVRNSTSGSILKFLIASTGSASSGNQTFQEISPIISQSSSAGYTTLLINPTESSTGSGTKRLISAQVGSVDRFVVDNTGAVTVTESTLGNAIQTLSSIATNDDPTQITYQNRVATTDATVTTLHTFTVPSSTTYAIEAVIIARRTGGSSGTAEDGARYKLQAVYNNIAGTATIIGSLTSSPVDENNSAWDCTFTTSGATVLVRVTGAANNNITWHMTSKVWQVST